MLRVIAILCLTVAPVFSLIQKALAVRVDTVPYGSSSYIRVPQMRNEAIAKGWINMIKPEMPAGYESLDLFCIPKDYGFCLYYDSTDNVAGAQFAFNSSRFMNVVLDWKKSGFVNWTINENGIPTNLWMTQIFFVPKDANISLTERSNSSILQKQITFTGYNHTLITVSTDVTKLEASLFTEQGCYSGMGTWYVYNITRWLECKEENMLVPAVAVSDGQISGASICLPGVYPSVEGETDWFEHPNPARIEAIITDGPDCIYDYAGWLCMSLSFVETSATIYDNDYCYEAHVQTLAVVST